ncbi:MAG: tetratricopeptide repeat protein [Polyangiaceae bacterium]
MALVLFEEGDAVGAAVEVRAAMARGPALPEAQLLLGRTLVETGRIDNGVERLRAAGALGGGDLGVPELARALALSGQASRAHALLERGPPSSWAGAGASSDAQAPAAAPEATPPVPDVSLRVERARLAVWARDAAWGERWLADVSLPVPARGPLAIVFALAELCARGADPRAHPAFSAPPLGGPRARRRAFLEQIHAEICASRGDVGGAVGAVARSAAAGLCDIAWLDRCPLLEEARIDPAFRAAPPRCGAPPTRCTPRWWAEARPRRGSWRVTRAARRAPRRRAAPWP